jgi:hypothetical protein
MSRLIPAILVVLSLVQAGCHARLAPAPMMPPPSPVAGNHPPTVSVSADGDHVAAGGHRTLSSTVYDPDGDRLSLQWSAPAGSFSNPTGGRTIWTAPATSGPVTITLRVDDGRGGATSESVTITVDAGP